MFARARNSTCRIVCVVLTTLVASSFAFAAKPKQPAVEQTAAAVDAVLAAHWKTNGIKPADRADDLALIRRLTLDLAGRLPTLAELDAFSADKKADRYDRLVQRLIESDEFSLHFARVVDGWIQQRNAGDEAFVAWLRRALDERRGWDDVFRAVLLGPWDKDDDKGAAKFLSKRVKNLDALTADSAQAFFGVDISCARCHDHPLIDQWKQRHYYGLAAFFGRTKEDKKAPGQIGEKNEGEVTFAAGGKQETASMMFLTGLAIEGKPKENRRERLVETALVERTMFSRAAVNRTWAWFFGRGLVHPVDQMHAANPPSVPAVLDTLADAFVASDYDLRFLAAAIVRTQAYRMSSRYDAQGPMPGEEHFAVARLRPLTREQFALAAELVLGDETFVKAADAATRRELYLAAEKRAAAWTKELDPAGTPHQASAAEALFLSNHATLGELSKPKEENLAARLDAIKTDDQRVDAMFRTLLGRMPTKSERAAARQWLGDDRDQKTPVASLLWALVTSAEFRFNH